MEKGDFALVIILILILLALVLLTTNLNTLFPTPTVKQAITTVATNATNTP